jgi:DNA-binding GntR family transcriptional regulator
MLHVTGLVSELQSLIRRVDLNDQVYDTLRGWLITRRLSPGEKLSMHVLADQLGVSRSPVHHALTRLVSEGLMTVRPRRGYYVTPITPKVVEDAYDVRLGAELIAAERSVDRATDEQLAELRRLMEETLPNAAPAPADNDDDNNNNEWWHGANRRFHDYQIDLAGNPLMSEIYRRLSVTMLMEQLLRGRLPAWLPAVSEEHVELVAAYEERDIARVQNAIRAHNATGRVLAAQALGDMGGMA